MWWYIRISWRRLYPLILKCLRNPRGVMGPRFKFMRFLTPPSNSRGGRPLLCTSKPLPFAPQRFLGINILHNYTIRLNFLWYTRQVRRKLPSHHQKPGLFDFLESFSHAIIPSGATTTSRFHLPKVANKIPAPPWSLYDRHQPNAPDTNWRGLPCMLYGSHAMPCSDSWDGRNPMVGNSGDS